MYVLDASVLIKWFSNEEYTDRALKLRDDFLQGYAELVVPDLLLYEVSNALRYNPNYNENDVIESVDSLYDMGINIIIPTGDVIKSAINLAFTHDVTLYDAFYAALAKEIDFTLITADAKFYRKTNNLGFIKFIDEIQVSPSDHDEGYIAVVPELRGCSAFGETEEKALEEVKIAIELWIETAKKDGKYIPQPHGKEYLKRVFEDTFRITRSQRAGA